VPGTDPANEESLLRTVDEVMYKPFLPAALDVLIASMVQR
jgi:hypothetical protein